MNSDWKKRAISVLAVLAVLLAMTNDTISHFTQGIQIDGEKVPLTDTLDQTQTNYETEESALTDAEMQGTKETYGSTDESTDESTDAIKERAGDSAAVAADTQGEASLNNEYDNRVDAFRRQWRVGNYSVNNGKYSATSTSRISHMDYDPVVGGSVYSISVSNAGFNMLIREMNANMKLIHSENCADGTQITLTEDTVYVGITLYPVQSGNYTYETYEELFGNGMVADFILVSSPAKDIEDVVDTEETETTVDTEETLETETTADTEETLESKEQESEEKSSEDAEKERLLQQFHATWKTGNYNCSTGKYEKSSTSRIAHVDYDEVVSGATYIVNISDDGFKMLIREMDANKKMVKSDECKDGTKVTLSDKTEYVGISLYSPSIRNLTYKSYEEYFQNGLTATFEPEFVVEQIQSSQNVTWKDLMKQMILDGDTVSRDVSVYHLKSQEVYDTFQTLIQSECSLEYACSPFLSLSVTCDSEDVAKTIMLSGFDDAFQEKVTKLRTKVMDATSGIKAEMSETEKALLLHDYLINHVEYLYDSQNYGVNAYSALVDEKAICKGYTLALALLYQEAGLESICVEGNDEYHAWLLVKLDGKYYHVDPTWNHLQSNYRHFYFLRSDAQFQNPDKGDAHFNWISEEIVPAASNTFDDWFVHNVVGELVYYDGFWYYGEGNKLMRAHIDGSQKETVYSGNASITVKSSDNIGVHFLDGDTAQMVR